MRARKANGLKNWGQSKLAVIYGLDTNIIIYYLTGQPEEKHKECLNLLKKAEKGEIELLVLPINIWESVWVLEKFFENPRDEIAHILSLFLELDGIKCRQKELITAALSFWQDNSIDFADAYIIKAYKVEGVNNIYSYDQHMLNKKMGCIEP
ncbi:MAG: hypothetical protein PWR10_1085 [Halanaerobiales bacterium]|nr:hypothetical protein [Halanaerobiales bacterium]